MPRWSEFDTDEERLPEGFQRIGYDADTQVYTFRDAEGKLWESAPGNRYGKLHQVTGGAAAAPPLPSHGDDDDDDDDDDDETNPSHPLTYGRGPSSHQHQRQQRQQQASWRHDMMPLLNWFLLVGLFLLAMIWFISGGSSKSGGGGGGGGGGSGDDVVRSCGDDAAPYKVKAGDTCWDIAEARSISVDALLEASEGLDCDDLAVGETLCIPLKA